MKTRRRITKRDDAPPTDPYEGPGAVAVEKLADDPDISVEKRIVRRGGDYCVLAENSDRSFGCFKTRREAAARLRQVEAFANKIGKAAPKKKAEPDNDSPGKQPTAPVAKAPHVHTVRVNGAELVTSADEGDPHSHRLTLPGGKRATLSQSKPGPGHTHTLVMDGKTLATSGPRNEGDKAKKRKPYDKKKTAKSTDLPRVLTFDACAAGEMPELGESGLPESLEQDVPPRFRYWKCEDAEDARLVRDALVEKQLFVPGCIHIVRGEPRRVIKELVEKTYLPHYLTKKGELPAIPADVRPILRAAALLVEKDEDADTVLLDQQTVTTFGVDAVVERAKSLASDWLISAPDDTKHRVALKALGGAYRLRTIADVIFATNSDFVETELLELVEPSREDELITKALESEMRLVIKSEEERIVYGVVLEPNTVDKQQDTISEEEIRTAAHKFMEDFGTLGLQHKEAINGDAKLLETFIAPADFEVNGDKITKGSWVMAERILNDALWKAVKKGEITGFSIGGSAVRRPVG